MTSCDRHVVEYRGAVRRRHREDLNRHKSGVYWLTGLSGSGKSTLAHLTEERLYNMGMRTYVFDGDNVRKGLCRDLSFSPEGRSENIRRIGEMVRLFVDAGIMCLTAFISPYREDREKVRCLVGGDDFYEIYVKCALKECEKRDAKGLYALAREGRIKNYTGISSPYEEPEDPDLVLETDKCSVEECVDKLIDFIVSGSKVDLS
ncbi:MAG: adenylyl-sulfate kinase [Desulfonatronovibrionaceae bacterium]